MLKHKGAFDSPKKQYVSIKGIFCYLPSVYEEREGK